MIPKIVCARCGNELAASDKFCSSCGASVESNESPPSRRGPGPAARGNEIPVNCPLCGQKNDPASSFCESCGAALRPSAPPLKERPAGKNPPQAKLPPLKALQSWKLTLGLAVVLIATLVISRSSRNNSPGPPEGSSAHASDAAQEIRSLQQTVDSNPQDAASTLRLANLYHDVRLYPKAITMYERYLQLNPSNPDARVDLGTSYFELSFEDTSRKDEYLGAAREAMEKALTYAPQHQMALFNLGIVRFHTGEFEQALESFRKCMAVDSTSDVGRKAKQFVNQHSSIEPSS
jgi:double zinc ribbon protein/tetratricopeptide repeat protein